MWAATDSNDATAVQLIQAQLPDGTALIQADGKTLGRAVRRAILDHPTKAPAILSAALSDGTSEKGAKNKGAASRSCDFVLQVFKAALRAAPDQASALTDIAMAIDPECVDSLTLALQVQTHPVAAYDYKDRPDFKDRSDYKDRAGAPVAGINNSAGEADDLGFGDGFGLGGFGPGFPGAPGFVGSAPSGGFALPPVALPSPVTAPVTSVVNQ